MTHFSRPKYRKMECMRSRVYVPIIFIVLILSIHGFRAPLAFAITPITKAEKMTVILDQLSSTDVQIDEGRSRLAKISTSEMQFFVSQASTRLDSKSEKRPAAVFAYELLSRRPDFSKQMAADVLSHLKPAKEGSSARSEGRLALFLSARAGVLTDVMIADDLKFVAQASKASADRLARLGALIDAMSEAGRRPTSTQLEKLLQNDVFEIRMLSVDWFRMQPPENTADRKRFLQQAVKTNPVQVRERAYRTIASWSAEDVKAVGADIIPKTCDKDGSLTIRTACDEIRSKAGKP